MDDSAIRAAVADKAEEERACSRDRDWDRGRGAGGTACTMSAAGSTGPVKLRNADDDSAADEALEPE